jgi:fructose-1,6-bisphosphatase/inositol monophosphatase family enzyme
MMGKVIAEEAGGIVRDFSGQPIVPLISRERNANLIAGNAAMVRLLGDSFA